jgi:hypothetical protein
MKKLGKLFVVVGILAGLWKALDWFGKYKAEMKKADEDFNEWAEGSIIEFNKKKREEELDKWTATGVETDSDLFEEVFGIDNRKLDEELAKEE